MTCDQVLPAIHTSWSEYYIFHRLRNMVFHPINACSRLISYKNNLHLPLVTLSGGPVKGIPSLSGLAQHICKIHLDQIDPVYFGCICDLLNTSRVFSRVVSSLSIFPYLCACILLFYEFFRISRQCIIYCHFRH